MFTTKVTAVTWVVAVFGGVIVAMAKTTSVDVESGVGKEDKVEKDEHKYIHRIEGGHHATRRRDTRRMSSQWGGEDTFSYHALITMHRVLSAVFHSPLYHVIRLGLYAVVLYCLLQVAYQRDRVRVCAHLVTTPRCTRWCSMLWNVNLGKYGKIELCYPGYVYREFDCKI